MLTPPVESHRSTQLDDFANQRSKMQPPVSVIAELTDAEYDQHIQRQPRHPREPTPQLVQRRSRQRPQQLLTALLSSRHTSTENDTHEQARHQLRGAYPR